MSKIIYDVIQRFEVENGVPRLVSTNIQVIEGGEDLLSLAISLLTKLGFYDKFEEKRTSQYIGYRVNNAGKGAKRYQLVLSQRKEELCISIPQEILEPYLLKLNFSTYFFTKIPEIKNPAKMSCAISTNYWIIPSKKNVFIKLTKEYQQIFQGQYFGEFEMLLDHGIINSEHQDFYIDNKISNFKLEKINNNDINSFDKLQEYFNNHPLLKDLDTSKCCLKIGLKDESKDKLFPYTLQVCINSTEVLEEFIHHFAKILMEKN
ncbi:hypothetical protein FJR04_24240 [Anabaena sp. UHCC 0204]|nr:hypothetical protein [Anabaena sp. UHCC 0204]